MDTVPEGDKSLWKYDPFQVNVEGDYIYGRELRTMAKQ